MWKLLRRFFYHPDDGKFFRLKNLSLGKFVCNGIYLTGFEKLHIGEHCYLGEFASLHAEGGIEIGSHTHLGPRVVVHSINHNHRRNVSALPYDRQRFPETEGVQIGKCVWIGDSAIILPGVNIGNHVVVGAGSVVSKSVPEFCIVAGNPARVVGMRDANAILELEKNGAFHFKFIES